MSNQSKKNRREQEELEKRILERLKQQVFDKDAELKNHQNDKSVREATKEALAEMTSLDKEDVNKLYQKIKTEEAQKTRREQLSRKTTRNTIYLVILVIGLIGVSVTYFALRPEPVLFSYVEDFETESSIFINEEDYNYKKNIENGEFVYQTNIDELCYSNSSPAIDFPKNYTITAKSNWKAGSYSMYGLILMNNNENYMVFAFNKEGKANVSVRHYDKYTDNDWNYKVFTDKSNLHTQRIEVKNKNYEYYIDDKFVRKGKLASFRFLLLRFQTLRPSNDWL